VTVHVEHGEVVVHALILSLAPWRYSQRAKAIPVPVPAGVR
jgi:hypothetical protein